MSEYAIVRFLRNNSRVHSEWSSPCPSSSSSFIHRRECSMNGTECASNQWCHIGKDQDSTVCCSGGEGSWEALKCSNHFCVLSNDDLGRDKWYINSNTQSVHCVFTNSRHIHSINQWTCRKVCCRLRANYGASKVRVIYFISSNQSLTIQFNQQTAIWYSAAQDPCVLPLNAGEGAANLTRWYVDPNDRSCNRQCKSFTYNGAKGNQNNFLTKALCEQKCKSMRALYTISREDTGCDCRRMQESLWKWLVDALHFDQRAPSVQPHFPLSFRFAALLFIFWHNDCNSSAAFWCHVGLTPETTVCCSAGL